MRSQWTQSHPLHDVGKQQIPASSEQLVIEARR